MTGKLALLLTLLFAAVAAAQTAFTPSTARVIPLEQYVSALETIEIALDARLLPIAKQDAALLEGTTVRWAKGTFAADASLLSAIRNAQAADGLHRARLLLTIDELRRAGGMEGAPTDPRLLERIAAEQEPPALPRGGDLTLGPQENLPLFERIATSIADMFRWVWEKILAFLDWLLGFLPRRDRSEAATPGLRWIVFAVVAAIVLLVLFLAIRVLRRSRRDSTAVEVSTPIGSRRDDDPLSRGAGEWERYAGELAAALRFREAIRAWYHAVLATCYAEGILHFRKGRTNWEYVASLAPSLEWRPDAIELTRRFEKEWYGSDQSSPEALEDCRERATRILETLREDLRGAA